MKTEEEIKWMVEQLEYKFLKNYMGNRYKRRIVIEDKHGYKYDVDFNHLISGRNPQIVCKENPFTLYNISLYLHINEKPFVLCEENSYNKSQGKLYFKCLLENCGEIFDSTWNKIFSTDCGCPFCSGKRVGKFNSLENLRPDLVKEWDYSRNNKSPAEYTISSNQKVCWKCSVCKESWEASICSRNTGKGCPYCAGQKVGENNNLCILRPDLLKEWDYERNERLPENYTSGSGKVVYWICSNCNHSWETSINNRNNGTNCPNCTRSLGEKYIYEFLSNKDFDFYIEFPLSNCKYKKQLWLDFYLPKMNLGIEYHGKQHYEPIKFFGGEKVFKDQNKRDKIKEKYCKNNNINLLIIPYWDYDNIEEILEETLSQLR